MTKISSQTPIWRLLAISVDPELSEPQLYGLILEGEKDRVLMTNERIVLFRDAKRASSVLHNYARQRRNELCDLEKPFFWCDIAQTLYLLHSGGTDDDATVLGAINALLDLTAAAGLAMPKPHRAALRSIADYCTFNKDLTKYLEEEGDFSSEALTSAVLWCVGAVTVRSTVV